MIGTETMCYFDELMYMPDATIETIAHHMKNPIFGRIDVVVGTGLSGTMGLVPLKQKTGCDILAIRKRETKCHGSTLESSLPRYPVKHYRYLILDDFISSGATVRRIWDELEKEEHRWECVGIILYGGFDSHKTRIPNLTIPIVVLSDEIRATHEMIGEYGGIL
jgi:adenine/guanine phosphoribosyltransferase-like PRPP-binding protein